MRLLLQTSQFKKLQAILIDYLTKNESEKYTIDVTVKSRYYAFSLSNLTKWDRVWWSWWRPKSVFAHNKSWLLLRGSNRGENTRDTIASLQQHLMLDHVLFQYKYIYKNVKYNKLTYKYKVSIMWPWTKRKSTQKRIRTHTQKSETYIFKLKL